MGKGKRKGKAKEKGRRRGRRGKGRKRGREREGGRKIAYEMSDARTHARTQRRFYTLSNAMHCIGQTKNLTSFLNHDARKIKAKIVLAGFDGICDICVKYE